MKKHGCLIAALVVIALGAIATAMPGVMLFGLALGPLGFPFMVAVGLLPTVALYLSIVLLVALPLRRLGRWRWLVGGTVAVLFGFAVPYLANRQADGLVAVSRAEDLRSGVPVTIDGPVLLRGVSTRPHQHPCGAFCQRLLYSGVAPRVILPTRGPTDETVQGVFIERRDACPPVQGALPSVAARIALGDCLVEAPAAIDEATLVYERTRAHDYVEGWRTWPLAHVLRLTRVEVRRGPDPDGERLYRRTAVEASLLATPLAIGASGEHLPEYAVVARYRHVYDALDEDDDFRVVHAEIFGDALQLPDVPDVDLTSAIRSGLLNRGSEKTHAHVLMEDRLDALRISREPASDDDLALIELAVSDPRMDDLWGLADVIRRRETVPPSLVRAMGARVAEPPGADDATNAIADAVAALPPGAAAPIRADLERIARDPESHIHAGPALSRLADSGPGVIPLLLDVLKQSVEASARDFGDQLERWQVNRILKTYREAGRAALYGLCRLGPGARRVEDTVLAVAARGVARDAFSDIEQAAVDALLSMGITRETLKARFGDTPTWRDINRAILSFERDRRAGRPFCGRVLPPAVEASAP